MFAQNNIERRGPLYPAPLLHLILNRIFFFNRVSSFSIFFPSPRFRKRFLPDAPPAKRRALVHYLCFSVLRASLNTRCAQYPESRVSLRRPGLDFHISLQSPLQLLDTRPRERSDTRAEFIQQVHGPDGGNLHLLADRWMALAWRNYLIVITTGRRLMTSASSVSRF